MGQSGQRTGPAPSPDVDEKTVGTLAVVVEHDRSYHELDEAAQRVVRAKWDATMTGLRRDLDLATEFQAEGRGWVEGDADGNVVH